MNRMPWYRRYWEARTDRKLDTLDDHEYRVWSNLMDYAAEQSGKRGLIPAEKCEPESLALECSRGDEELLAATIAKCAKLRILTDTDEGLLFVHFEERQYDKPSDMPSATAARKRVSRAVTPGHAVEEKRVDKKREEQPRVRAKSVRLPACMKVPHPALDGKTVEQALWAEIEERFPGTTLKQSEQATFAGAITDGCPKFFDCDQAHGFDCACHLIEKLRRIKLRPVLIKSFREDRDEVRRELQEEARRSA